jgi:hypothetical protein
MLTTFILNLPPMHKHPFILLIISLVYFQNAFSQHFIGKSREKVVKKLHSYEKKDNIHTVINETDSTVTFLLRDTGWQHLDKHFYFNEKGKCYKEVLQANCDSCYQKYLSQALNIKMYKWQKISSLKYLSNFTWKLLLEIDPLSAFTYSIQKINLSKIDFNKLRMAEKS